MKLLAGSLASLPDNIGVVVLSGVRLIALTLCVWVVAMSWSEIKKIPNHLKVPKSKSSMNISWNLERAHLWVPPILLGAIDAYPIGTIKGLLLTKPDALKTFLSCTLGSLVVGLITLAVAHLVVKIENRLSPFHVGTVIFSGILHLSIFTSITLAILIEWYYVMLNLPHDELKIWIPPIFAALAMAIFLVVKHGKEWKRLMREANHCDQL
jgi:hypothetical protein